MVKGSRGFPLSRSESRLGWPRMEAFVRRHLSRVSRSGEWLAEIDGLRFVAILLVVVFHCEPYVFGNPGTSSLPGWDLVHHVAERGWIGVPLFFVISGFILALPFVRSHAGMRRPVALRRYYHRRLVRLEPPYVICLLVFLVYKALMSGSPWHSLQEQFPHFLASATYTHGLVYQSHSTINNVAWTLEIEVQFYLAAPFLCQVFRISNTWMRRLLLGGLLLAFSLMAGHLGGEWRRHLPGHLSYFLAGLLLADLYVHTLPHLHVPELACDLIGVIAWATAIGMEVSWPRPLVILLAYVATLQGRVLRRWAGHLWIATIGGMCYSIYLYHNLFIGWGRSLFGTDSNSYWAPLQLVGLLGIVLLGSIVCFVLFERPFMKMGLPKDQELPKRRIP